MYTTNTATRRLSVTYAQRRRECEKLAEIARRIESLTSEPSFEDNPAFEKLEGDYRQQLQNVVSLSL
jgi:hypothetical protein